MQIRGSRDGFDLVQEDPLEEGNPLQYSSPAEVPMDVELAEVTIYRVTRVGHDGNGWLYLHTKSELPVVLYFIFHCCKNCLLANL